MSSSSSSSSSSSQQPPQEKEPQAQAQQKQEQEQEQEQPAKPKRVTATDVLLPAANVDQVIRRVLPPDHKLASGAAALVQEAASEFIAFLTLDTANEMRVRKRKTLSEEDLLEAVTRLGFTDFDVFLRDYTERLRERKKRQRAGGE